MKMTQTDKARCDELIKCMNKVTYNLEASELPALMQIFQWLGELKGRIEADLINEKFSERELALKQAFAAELQSREDLAVLSKDVAYKANKAGKAKK